MTAFATNGTAAFAGLPAAFAALTNDPATIQTININTDNAGASAFGAISPGDKARVVINGVIKPDGSLPQLAAMGTFVRLAWGKAILNVETVAELTIQNLLLTDAAVANDSNGAAVRINPGAKTVHLKNVIGRNCENGVLSDGADLITVEDCLWDNNGQSSSKERQGYSHNGYYAGRRLEIRRSTFQDSQFGHDLKSRMKENVISQSRMEGSKEGRAFDLSNGGIWESEGNEYIKHADATQNNLIHLVAEGVKDTRQEKYTSKNDLFSIDIPYGRALQYINNQGGVECVLTDPKFVLQGVEISDEDAAKLLVGSVRIVLTGGPRGPLKPVGRQGNTQAAPVEANTDAPAPAAPAPAPAPVPAPVGVSTMPSTVLWVKIADERGEATVNPGTVVRYGFSPNWVEKTVSGVFTATNEFFGSDPMPGISKVVEKRVIMDAPVVTPPIPVPAPATQPAQAGAVDDAFVAAAVAFLKSLGYTVSKD